MNYPISLANALFTETQRQVLGLLYGSPEKSFYLNEILRTTGMGVATIKRELERMEAAGILTRTKIGNQHHFQANPACSIFKELLSLVAKVCNPAASPPASTAFNYPVARSPSVAAHAVHEQPAAYSKGLLESLKQLAHRSHIRRLSLFGSAARGELTPDSDIDLLVEFEPNQTISLGDMAILAEQFSSLFGGRKVDLATKSILKNPYRRRTIERDLRLLYAAE